MWAYGISLFSFSIQYSILIYLLHDSLHLTTKTCCPIAQSLSLSAVETHPDESSISNIHQIPSSSTASPIYYLFHWYPPYLNPTRIQTIIPQSPRIRFAERLFSDLYALFVIELYSKHTLVEDAR